jgi:hypothetical protein
VAPTVANPAAPRDFHDGLVFKAWIIVPLVVSLKVTTEKYDQERNFLLLECYVSEEISKNKMMAENNVLRIK